MIMSDTIAEQSDLIMSSYFLHSNNFKSRAP